MARRRFQAGGLNQLSNQEDRLNAGAEADAGLIDLPRGNFSVESLDDPYSGFSSDYSDLLPMDHPLMQDIASGVMPPMKGKAGPLGTQAKESLLKMYETLTPSAGELTGADAALQGAIQKLVKLNEYRPTEMNLPLLSLASGLLSPTKTGSTFESIGQAIPGALEMFKGERRYEDQRHQAQSEAEIALQRAAKDSMLARQKLGVSALGNAARIEAAEQRGGRGSFKVVAGVGLVRLNPDGTHEVVEKSPDPWNDPKIMARLTAEGLKDADKYDFAGADERNAYVDAWVARKLQKPGATAPGATAPAAPGQPAPAGARPAAPALAPVAAPPAQLAPPADPALEAEPPAQDMNQLDIPVPSFPAKPPSQLPGSPVLIPDDEKAGRKQEAKKLGDLNVEQFQDANNLATAFRSMADQGKVVRAIGAETGRLAPFKQWAGGYLNALGLANEDNSKLVKDATNLQQTNAALMQVVLSRQLEQKGVQTDGDARRMEATFTKLDNNVAANDFILRATDAQAERARQQVNFMENWKGKKGSFEGAKTAWGNYLAQTPIIGRIKQGDKEVPVFMNEWMARARQANPDAPTQELINRWRQVAK